MILRSHARTSFEALSSHARYGYTTMAFRRAGNVTFADSTNPLQAMQPLEPAKQIQCALSARFNSEASAWEVWRHFSFGTRKRNYWYDEQIPIPAYTNITQIRMAMEVWSYKAQLRGCDGSFLPFLHKGAIHLYPVKPSHNYFFSALG